MTDLSEPPRTANHVTTYRKHDPDTCAHCQRNRNATTDLHDRPGWVHDAVLCQIAER